MRTVSRANKIYSRKDHPGRLPVCKTKFFAEYVFHPGGPEFVPGTNVRRLRPVQLGEKIQGFFDDEVDALLEALRAEQEAKLLDLMRKGEDVRPRPRVPRKAVDQRERA